MRAKTHLILIVLGTLNLVALGILTRKVFAVEVLLSGIPSHNRVGTVSPLPAPTIPPKEEISESYDSVAAGVDFKKASDIKDEVQKVSESSVEELAHAITEIDTWTFPPDELTAATNETESALALLCERIATRIRDLSKSAVEANDGKTAEARM